MTCSGLVRDALLSLALLGVAVSARAADLRNVLVDYTLTTWTTETGLPGSNLRALAQDEDGYLWVGTEAGLARFDGVRFVAWPTEAEKPAVAPVNALFVSSDGSLWVGLSGSLGIRRLKDGQMSRFAASEGLPDGGVATFAEDADGTMWAGTESGLFSLAENRWTRWPSGMGLPDTPVYGAFVDRDSTFYVGTANGVFRRAHGSRVFQQVERSSGTVYRPSADERLADFDEAFNDAPLERDPASTRSFPRSFVQSPSGLVLTNDWQSGFRAIGASRSSNSRVRARGMRLLADRRENLWIATAGQGLWRLRLGADGQVVSTDRATALTGLGNDGVTALFEDREGNIWAGVQAGLTRLMPRRIRQLTDFGLVMAIEGSRDKSVWVGTLDALIRFVPGRPESPSATFSLGDAMLRVLHADRGGTLWAATDRGLSKVGPDSQSLTPVPGPASLKRIELMASDAAGTLWLYTEDRRLFSLARGRLSAERLPPPLDSAQISLLHIDRSGRLWAGLTDGRMVFVDGDTVNVVDASRGLNIGVCRQVFEDDDGIVWLAGSDGLGRYADGGFVTLRSGEGFPYADLVAIVEDDVHDLWIGTGSGVLRIPRDDLGWNGEKPEMLRHTLYNFSRGLAGHPHAYDSNNRVVRADDGRLWFVTARGLSLIDPQSLRNSRPVERVKIDYATIDEQRQDATSGLALPAGTSRVQIMYSQLNLSSLSQPRFRTRLEGFDAEWINSGTRITATYTNLPPRAYRFHVSPVDASGASLEPEAVWEFSIKPWFYQTAWFMSMSVVCVIATVGGLWRLRVRRIRRHFSDLIAERVRLSRDLHDTLLQNLVAIALQFDAAAADTDVSSESRRRLVLTRKQVEENIREARQMIWDLRMSRHHRRDLVGALRAIGEHATADRRMSFELHVNGVPRSCPRQIEEHLLRIGQEAVVNAVRHSSASHIRIAITFDQHSIRLQVTDDGCGFDSRVVGEYAGHYGLTVMRERAAEIGANFEVRSTIDHGTEITATVPLAA